MGIFERLLGRDRDDDMSETDTTEPVIDETEPDTAEQQDTDDTEQTVRDLDVRVRDIETSMDKTESSLDAIRGTQDELADDIGDLNDTIRQLLGVYEQLTASSNPFETTHDGFGVVDDHSEDELTPASEPVMDTNSEAQKGGESEDEHAESVVTFDDLHDGLLAADDEAPTAMPEDELLTSESVENKAPASESVSDETPAPESVNDQTPAVPTGERAIDDGKSAATQDKETAATLESVNGGYAADLLVMEWLSMLIEESGPASTLKTLEYYESIKWLSPTACQQLERYLGGPNLDVHIDPNSPSELTGKNHAVSHRYIRLLATLSANTR